MRAASVRLTVLGSGDAFSGGGRGSAAYIVEDAHGRLLVDCGPTVPHALKARGLTPAAIPHLLVTHLHGDHIAGLPFVILSGMYEEPERGPLELCGPPLLARQSEALFATCYPDVVGRPRPFRLEYREIAPGGQAFLGGRRVTAFRMHHMSGEYDCLGYRIETSGRVVAFTGDTGAEAPLQDLARDADLFVCECTNPAGVAGGKHLSTDDIRRLRSGWSARRVLLTHLSARAREEARSIPDVELADDGAVVEV